MLGKWQKTWHLAKEVANKKSVACRPGAVVRSTATSKIWAPSRELTTQPVSHAMTVRLSGNVPVNYHYWLR